MQLLVVKCVQHTESIAKVESSPFFLFFFFFLFTHDMSVNICLLKRRSCCHSTKDFYQKVIMPFLHFSSKNKSLNCDDGGLLPDAYFHLVRKKAAN